MKKIVSAFVVIALAGCAGRTANPVSAYQTYDGQLSCQQLTAEIAANEDKARQLGRERENANARNAAVTGVGLILFWPALFALDLSDAEKVEIAALQRRNDALVLTKNAKHCK